MPADDVLSPELRAALDVVREAAQRTQAPSAVEIAKFSAYYPGSHAGEGEHDWAVAICAQAAHGALEAGDTAVAAAALRAARGRLLRGMSLLVQASAALDALGMQVKAGRYESDRWAADQARLRHCLGEATET